LSGHGVLLSPTGEDTREVFAAHALKRGLGGPAEVIADSVGTDCSTSSLGDRGGGPEFLDQSNGIFEVIVLGLLGTCSGQRGEVRKDEVREG
jgi:hypothetical protein